MAQTLKGRLQAAVQAQRAERLKTRVWMFLKDWQAKCEKRAAEGYLFADIAEISSDDGDGYGITRGAGGRWALERDGVFPRIVAEVQRHDLTVEMVNHVDDEGDWTHIIRVSWGAP